MEHDTMTPDALKRARTALNISQAELAHRLGLSRPSIARMESGRQAIRPVMALAMEYLLLLHNDEAA